MSRFAVLAFLVVLVSTGCGLREEGLSDRSREPTLSADPKVIDVGDVPIHSKHEFHTQIVNHGAMAVTIKKVRPNCGCTEVHLDKMNLAPGEATSLSGVYEVGSSPGSASKQIAIVPAAGRSIAVRVEANRIRTVPWEPDVLTLRPDLVAGAADTGRFVVSNQSVDQISLSSSSSSLDGLAIEVDSSEIPPGGRAEVAVTAAWDLVQNRAIVVKLTTTHPHENHLELPVEIRPKYAIDVEPEAIHFGVVSKSELLRKDEIRVRYSGAALDYLDSVGTKTVPFLDVLDSRSSVPQSADLLLTVVDKFPGSDLSGAVEIGFRHLERSISIELPVTGFLMDVN